MTIEGISGRSGHIQELGTEDRSSEVRSESTLSMHTGTGWPLGSGGPAFRPTAHSMALRKPVGVKPLAQAEVLGAADTSWAVFGKGGDKGLLVWIPGGYGRVLDWGQDPASFAESHDVGRWASEMAAKGYEVLVYNRGTGHNAEISDGRTDYGSDADAQDLQQLLTDLETRGEISSADKVFLMGHSWGGRAAMAYAAAHPDTVAGAVIMDMGPFDYREGNGARREDYERALAARDFATAERIFFTGEPGTPSYEERVFPTRDDLLDALVRVLRDGAGLPLQVARERGAQFVAWNGYRGRKGWKVDSRPWIDGLMDYTKARESLGPHLASMARTMPVTVLKADPTSGEAVVTDEDVPLFLRLAPTLDVVTLPGAGHNVWEADPRGFAELTAPMVEEAMAGKPPQPKEGLAVNRPWGRPSS